MAGLGALAALCATPAGALDRAVESPLYGPADLSYFADPIAPAPGIRFGYAAITWEGNDLQAIREISELDFKGIQLRSDILRSKRGSRLRQPAVRP